MYKQNIGRTSSLDFAAFLKAKDFNLLGIEAAPSEKDFFEFLFSIDSITYEKLRSDFNQDAEVSAVRLLTERKSLIQKLAEKRKL